VYVGLLGLERRERRQAKCGGKNASSSKKETALSKLASRDTIKGGGGRGGGVLRGRKVPQEKDGQKKKSSEERGPQRGEGGTFDIGGKNNWRTGVLQGEEEKKIVDQGRGN